MECDENKYVEFLEGIWIYVRVSAGVALWTLVLPLYLLAVRLIHGCWLSKESVFKAMNRTYLEQEYGGRENVLLMESFYGIYVKPYEVDDD